MEARIEEPTYSFLKGGGEMGALTRHYDWSCNSLGSPAFWPQSLRTTLSILLNSRFPMFLFWGKDLICFYNDAFRPSFGINGKHPWALGKKGKDVWQEIWPTIKPWLDQVLEGGEALWQEDQLVGFYRNGRMEDIYWTFSYSPVSDEEGKIAGVLVTCTETTEKIRLIDEIESSRQEFQQMLLRAPVAISVFRGNDYIAELANDAYLPMVGKTRQEFIGRPFFDSLPETRTLLEPLLRKVRETGESFIAKEFEVVFNRYGKEEACFFNWVCEPLYNKEGQIDGLMVVAHEVTEHIIARKKLEEVVTQLKIFKSLADDVTDFIGICDMNLEPIYINQSGKKIAGLEKVEEGSGIKIIDFFYPEDQEFILKEFLPQVRIKGTAETEIRFRHFTTGEPIWMLYNVIFLKDQKGDPYGFATISKDVTRQKLFRQELQQQVQERTKELEEKNRELKKSNINLEEFAYAASHDLKEPIRKIHFFADRLKNMLNSRLSEEELRLFHRMEESSRKMGTLIEDLLAYSQVSRGAHDIEEMDLNQVLQQALNDLELEIEESNAQINISSLPRIKGQPRQIQQALQNLVSNAIKFHKQGKSPVVYISCRKVNAQNYEFLKTTDPSKKYFLITVSDEGIGFDQSESERIFNVFTRLHGNAEYRGTGVGLSIVRKVAENHGGFVKAKGEPGKGASFEFLIADYTDQ